MKSINMKSFKAKLLVIFFIPSFAFLYFSYLYIQKEYALQHEITKYKYSLELSSKLSDLIHTLQIERGVSAGYLVFKNENIKMKLLKQYKLTDKNYNKLLQISHDITFVHNISNRNRNILYITMNALKKLESIRKSVLASSIDFNKEIEYYSNINDKLILFMKNVNSDFIHLHHDSDTMNNFLKIQEYAGLERAYSYNYLLSKRREDVILWNIKAFEKERKRIEDKLLMTAASDSVGIYKRFYKKEIEAQVRYCFEGVLKSKSIHIHAEKCFYASTRYINMLNKIYENILEQYIKKADMISANSFNHLYTVLAVSALSVFSILFLLYILLQLILNEENNKIDLQIAAYTFEAQEGVVITDAKGKILKVNKSFSAITGYSAEEAIGKTPRILKSNEHPESFYENIWRELSEKGSWQSEIINRRKNGETYSEMLFISSIKNEEGIITHHIAQFLDISEIKEAQKALQHQVDHDFLTGLFNRKALKQRLLEEYAKSKRYDLKYAFLFIDLDGFKTVNDTYGHAVGDKVLEESAKRLNAILREEDIVARISGDEFGILITNLPQNHAAAVSVVEHIALKILEELSKEMKFQEVSLQISSSIGIKIFPDVERGFENIIVDADKAMYKAKHRGKNQFVFYCEVA